MAFGELWYLLKLNLLFLTACIPIVTVPMAVTAGLRITSSLAAGKQPPLWRAFCSAFFGEWKRALACGWALTLLQALAGFGVYAYAVMMEANPLALLALIAAALILRLFSPSAFIFIPCWPCAGFPCRTCCATRSSLPFRNAGATLWQPLQQCCAAGRPCCFSGYAAARHTPSACACAACGFLRNQAGP